MGEEVFAFTFLLFLTIIDLYPPHSVLILKCISHKIDMCREKKKTLGKAVSGLLCGLKGLLF